MTIPDKNWSCAIAQSFLTSTFIIHEQITLPGQDDLQGYFALNAHENNQIFTSVENEFEKMSSSGDILKVFFSLCSNNICRNVHLLDEVRRGRRRHLQNERRSRSPLKK